MISPIPFCPSFEPCAKLTPVQVKIRRPRIHHAGALAVSGARYAEIFAYDDQAEMFSLEDPVG
jgi:hypothetical protein